MIKILNDLPGNVLGIEAERKVTGSDYENASKDGINDKKCLLGTRLEGRQPIAVIGLANTYEFAVSSEIDKLKTSLDTILGQLRHH